MLKAMDEISPGATAYPRIPSPTEIREMRKQTTLFEHSVEQALHDVIGVLRDRPDMRAHMKHTDMRDNLREGDISQPRVMPVNGMTGNFGGGVDPQVIQNVAMFDFLDALTAGEDKVARWESAGSLRNGRNVWALLNLPDSEIVVGKDDRLLPYLLVTNAHDGSAACRVIPTTVRVVCMNTLQAAIAGEFRDLTVTIRHTGDVTNKIAEAKLMLAQAGAMFGAFEKVANELATKPVARKDFDALVEELFPTPAEDATDAVKTRMENKRELLAAAVVEERKLLAAPDMTAWTLLNGVTRFVDHAQRVQLRGRDVGEARFENSFIGTGAALKAKAAAKLIELARAS